MSSHVRLTLVSNPVGALRTEVSLDGWRSTNRSTWESHLFKVRESGENLGLTTLYFLPA